MDEWVISSNLEFWAFISALIAVGLGCMKGFGWLIDLFMKRRKK